MLGIARETRQEGTLFGMRVFAGCKAAVARQMKSQTDNTNAWVAKVLEMSAPTYVC